MTTTKIDLPTPDQKEEHRKELAKQVDEFLANGGKITQCPPNAFTEIGMDGKPKRKFSVLISPDSLTDPTNRSIGGFVQHKKKED